MNRVGAFAYPHILVRVRFRILKHPGDTETYTCGRQMYVLISRDTETYARNRQMYVFVSTDTETYAKSVHMYVFISADTETYM